MAGSQRAERTAPRRGTRCARVALALAGCAPGAAAPLPTGVPPELDTFVARTLAEWELPGAAVAIVKDGSTWSRSAIRWTRGGSRPSEPPASANHEPCRRQGGLVPQAAPPGKEHPALLAQHPGAELQHQHAERRHAEQPAELGAAAGQLPDQPDREDGRQHSQRDEAERDERGDHAEEHEQRPHRR